MCNLDDSCHMYQAGTEGPNTSCRMLYVGRYITNVHQGSVTCWSASGSRPASKIWTSVPSCSCTMFVVACCSLLLPLVCSLLFVACCLVFVLCSFLLFVDAV